VFLLGMPMLLIPVAIYHMIALLTPGVQWTSPATSIHMVSGAQWAVTFGDMLIMLALLLLYGEIFKATRLAARSIVDHVLSFGLFVAMLVEFILWAPFATSTYAILIIISLVDVIGGFTVTIRTAQRDLMLERTDL
jgi:hypothetical protein